MDWHRGRVLTTALFVTGIVLLVGLVAVSAAFGWYALSKNSRIAALRESIEIVQGIFQAAVDAEAGALGFSLTADPNYLSPYYSGIERTTELVKVAAEDQLLSSATSPQGKSLRDLIAAHQQALSQLIDTVRAEGGVDAAQRALAEGKIKATTDEIRSMMRALDESLDASLDKLSRSTDRDAELLTALLVVCMALAIVLSSVQFVLFRREIRYRRTAEADLKQRHRQIALISQLADSLHSSTSREESYRIIEAFARDILAETGGCLYVYNNSRDQLSRAATWGKSETIEYFGPDECWGLRRGKLHISSTLKGHVHCDHVTTETPRSYLCLPITARGQTSGLLHLQSPDADDTRAFEAVRTLASNFADQLSLALVNIELRERLQNMAIKDPLTELYNRRFLDEALSRELLLTNRRKTKLSVLMLDIDHFKRVNDTYGHPAGDEILKQVAHYLVRALRRSDIVCRYGGEEMVAVLPECDLGEAVSKATSVLNGVRSLPLRAGGLEVPSITVSIGIACYPDHGIDGVELLATADQALYRAKRAGRDRVMVADAQPSESAAIAHGTA